MLKFFLNENYANSIWEAWKKSYAFVIEFFLNGSDVEIKQNVVVGCFKNTKTFNSSVDVVEQHILYFPNLRFTDHNSGFPGKWLIRRHLSLVLYNIFSLN